MSRSAEYYRRNPRARRVKNKKSAEINRRPEQKRRRALLNRINRKNGVYGNGDGKDLSHTKDGLKYKHESVNRGSTSDQPGDRRARGRKRRR